MKDFLKVCRFATSTIAIFCGAASIVGIILIGSDLKDNNGTHLFEIIGAILFYALLCVLCGRAAWKLSQKIDVLEAGEKTEIFMCKECKKMLRGIYYDGVKIRGDIYCRKCAESVPSCDKCKYHYKNEIYPKYGCCAYFNQYLQDYDNICDAYGTGRQVHPDVYV